MHTKLSLLLTVYLSIALSLFLAITRSLYAIDSVIRVFCAHRQNFSVVDVLNFLEHSFSQIVRDNGGVGGKSVTIYVSILRNAIDRFRNRWEMNDTLLFLLLLLLRCCSNVCLSYWSPLCFFVCCECCARSRAWVDRARCVLCVN